ncbi:MAG TPA: FkbM family methyltransferase [Cellulomonas sp.]
MPLRSSRRLSALASALRGAARRAPFVEDEVLGLEGLVEPGAVCLDVGAEFGLYTWSLADLVGPSGAVHAVEPQPDLGRLLRFGRWLVGARNVTIHHLALGDQPGQGHLSQPSRGVVRVHGRTFLADGTNGLGSNAEFSRHRSIDVRVDTLDALVERLGLTRLDLVKADVEGAEGRLLASADQTLRRFRPHLLLELEDRHLDRFDTSVDEVVKRLADLGYEPSHWERDDWRPGIVGRNVLFRSPVD